MCAKICFIEIPEFRNIPILIKHFNGNKYHCHRQTEVQNHVSSEGDCKFVHVSSVVKCRTPNHKVLSSNWTKISKTAQKY